MTGELDGLVSLFTGKPVVVTDQVDGAQQGRVLAVDVGAGTAVITLDGFGAERRFGPIPYGRTDTPPEVGDICVAIFVGKGIHKGWLLRWAADD